MVCVCVRVCVWCVCVCACVQVTSGELGEFREWLRESVRGDHPYLQRLEATDVQPCLNFHNRGNQGLVRLGGVVS